MLQLACSRNASKFTAPFAVLRVKRRARSIGNLASRSLHDVCRNDDDSTKGVTRTHTIPSVASTVAPSLAINDWAHRLGPPPPPPSSFLPFFAFLPPPLLGSIDTAAAGSRSSLPAAIYTHPATALASCYYTSSPPSSPPPSLPATDLVLLRLAPGPLYCPPRQKRETASVSSSGLLVPARASPTTRARARAAASSPRPIDDGRFPLLAAASLSLSLSLSLPNQLQPVLLQLIASAAADLRSGNSWDVMRSEPPYDLRQQVDMQGGGGVAAADSPGGEAPRPSRYESQKRRDWHTFGQYLRNHRPPLELSRCSGAHVLEFLRYLDQFGKTKVHAHGCPFFGHPSPPAPCPCPLKQAWGSLDALVGRLRAAFEEHGGKPEANPFGARAVRLYLREVRDSQAKARGIAYEKKRRKRSSSSSSAASQQQQQAAATPPPPQGVSSPAMSDAAAGNERAAVVEARAHVPEAVVQAHAHHHHFFFPPHPQFLHGFSLVPSNHHHHHHEGVPAGNNGGGSSSSAGDGGGGDEMALALAAAAEAHAAGCLLPLSVFN
ncbi:hypothetical protein HU200_059173 [Digitaria exilis]|uniref:ALOG domain-containing protein n=1 Tax=Digitaria exilis TaxID=1010633 RepID=A0A835ACG9_9POAL|nr:hypothetical protein HU200_059173 [Digitaria exilis]